MRINNKYLLGLSGLLILAACSPQLKIATTEKKLIPITENLKQDSTIMAFYKPYKRALDSIMNDVVAVSTKEIAKGSPESLLGNFFADAMYESAKKQNIAFDMAYTNSGGLRNPLPEGNIYRYKIFELMPFENAFVTVKFTGAAMQNFFDFVAAGGGDPISGARFIIDNKKAVDITINGKPFDSSKEYVVLTSDYMANGGDGGEIFSKNIERKDYTYKLRDALLDYLADLNKNGKKLNPVNDGRIKIK